MTFTFLTPNIFKFIFIRLTPRILGVIVTLMSLWSSTYASTTPDNLPLDLLRSHFYNLDSAFSTYPSDTAKNPAEIGWERNPRNRATFYDVQPLGVGLTSNSNTLPALDTKGLVNHWAQSIFKTSNTFPNKLYYVEPKGYASLLLGGKEAPSVYLAYEGRSGQEVLTLNNPLYPTIQTYLSSQTIQQVSLGLALRSKGGVFTLGFNVRPNYRQEYLTTSFNLNNAQSLSSFTKYLSQNSRTTYAVGKDIGFYIRGKDQWFPTLGVSLTNIGGTCVDSYENLVTLTPQTVCGSLRYETPSSSSYNSETFVPDYLRRNASVDPMSLNAMISIMPRFNISKVFINLRLTAMASPIPIRVGNAYYSLDYASNLTDIFETKAELLIGNPFVEKKQFLNAFVGSRKGNIIYGGKINLFNFFLIEYNSFVASKMINSTLYKDRRHYLGISLNLY
jgi:hypothetical protein